MLTHARASRRPWGIIGVFAALLAGLFWAGPALGEQRHSEQLDFLDVLRSRGYADVAVDYLTLHQNDPTLPADIRDIWDLQMASSMWAASNQATSEQEAAGLRAQAQTHLEKFVREKPNHPAVADALITWASSSLDRAADMIRYAKSPLVKPAERDKSLIDARQQLADAQKRILQAIDLYKKQLDAMRAQAPAAGKAPAGGQATAAGEALADLKYRWIEARFKAGLVDYWTAQTYLTPTAPERKAAFNAGAAIFDGLYHELRGEPASMMAHFWHAKIVGESGDPQTALDICDEIMVISPDIQVRRDMDPETMSLLADAFILHLQMRVKQGQDKAALEEAIAWLHANARLQSFPAYQGIALERIKMEVPQLSHVSESRRKSYLRTFVEQLAKIKSIRSNYQQEAILLHRQLMQEISGGVEAAPKTYQEAVDAAESEVGKENWQGAIDLYGQALKMLEDAKISSSQRKDQKSRIRDRLASARYHVAYNLYAKNQLAEAAKVAEAIAREMPDTVDGANAASSALKAMQRLETDPRASEADRKALQERLAKLAEFTRQNWPGRPEADDASIALALIELQRGNREKAVALFSSVSPKSTRYATALLAAGRQAWRLYMVDKAKPKSDAATLAKMREDALRWLNSSLENQHEPDAAKPDPERLKQFRQDRAETQLLLAEINMDGGHPDVAAAMCRPLLEASRAEKSLDLNTLRAYAWSIRAYEMQGDMSRAADLAVDLARRGGDQQQVNGILVGLVTYLVKDLQKAEALDTIASAGSDIPAAERARSKLNESRSRLAALLVPLSTREQLSLNTILYLGENCARSGLRQQARAVYQRILDRAQKDAKFAKSAGPLITSTRAHLIALLRDENRLPEAKEEIDKLIHDNPRSFDLLMQRGLILQAWAKTDPKQYPEAVSQWTELRLMLSRMQKRPPAYFEVIFNAAECLVAASEQGPDNTRATSANQAELLLKAALVEDPKLSGPEMVAKYKVLINRAAALQGRKAAE